MNADRQPRPSSRAHTHWPMVTHGGIFLIRWVRRRLRTSTAPLKFRCSDRSVCPACVTRPRPHTPRRHLLSMLSRSPPGKHGSHDHARPKSSNASSHSVPVCPMSTTTPPYRCRSPFSPAPSFHRVPQQPIAPSTRAETAVLCPACRGIPCTRTPVELAALRFPRHLGLGDRDPDSPADDSSSLRHGPLSEAADWQFGSRTLITQAAVSVGHQDDRRLSHTHVSTAHPLGSASHNTFSPSVTLHHAHSLAQSPNMKLWGEDYRLSEMTERPLQPPAIGDARFVLRPK